jgi:hypothetical protein
MKRTKGEQRQESGLRNVLAMTLNRKPFDEIIADFLRVEYRGLRKYGKGRGIYFAIRLAVSSN